MEKSLPTVPGALADRIQDSDEKIRAAICMVIGSVEYETALHNLSQQTLRAVGGRMSDKKVCRALIPLVPGSIDRVD
jgi:hypothetical protein